jgi:hypothetical protein
MAMPPREQRDTFTKLYLSAMRAHSRKAALLHRPDGQWLDVPDWRLDRQVIRFALFARERLGFQAGQTVAIVSPLSPDSVVADLAAMMSGGISAMIDPRLPDTAIADALAVANPDLLVVDPGCAERVGRLQLSRVAAERTILLGTASHASVIGTGADASLVGAASDASGGTPLSVVLDLGGALDSAERAVAWRGRARATPSTAPALFHASVDVLNRLQCDVLTHEDMSGRIAGATLPLLDQPARAHAYCAHVTSLDERLAFYACLTNGAISTAIGSPGREPDDRAELAIHTAPSPRRSRLFDRRLSS